VLEALFRILVRRVDLKRLAEVRDGLFFVALLVVDDAPVEVGEGIVPIERDGLVEVRDGAVKKEARQGEPWRAVGVSQPWR